MGKQSQYIPLSLGKVAAPQHFLMSDVKQFNAGVASYHSKSRVNANAQLIASYNNGAPLIAVLDASIEQQQRLGRIGMQNLY